MSEQDDGARELGHKDGTEQLCRALYGRKAQPRDFAATKEHP